MIDDRRAARADRSGLCHDGRAGSRIVGSNPCQPPSTDEIFTAFSHTWQPDFPFNILTADSQVDPETWGQVPRTYIRFTQDGNIRPEEQDRLIAEADALTPPNKTDVHSVPGGHVDPFAQAVPLVTTLQHLA